MALRDICGVTQGRLFKGQEMSFSTKSVQCAGSCIREIVSANVLAAVGITYIEKWHESFRSHCIASWLLEVPLFITLSVVVLSVRTMIHLLRSCSFHCSRAIRTVNVS